MASMSPEQRSELAALRRSERGRTDAEWWADECERITGVRPPVGAELEKIADRDSEVVQTKVRALWEQSQQAT